ncbi:MAG: ABC transporter ATP-binding protein [Anaerolineales bacterium]|nr:ABC transporter ATP-binding protein [Anaerolineales bacterium]
MNVITVENLYKHYDSVRAVDGLDFEVHQGEIFGFLGPNGAGKTTTIEIIEGYKKPSNGRAMVLGLDPIRSHYELHERIGIMLQQTSLYQDLKVGELLQLFASYYRRSVNPDTLLEMIGLEEKCGAFIRTLSGGQRQRVVFVLALINDPELLFLDEPTAGLDPQSRRAIWEWIDLARDKGKTVFLTTHYIEEAERLCDRVAIIDHGRIIALDTPKRLMSATKVVHRIELVVEGALDVTWLDALPGVNKTTINGKNEYTLFVCQVQTAIKALMELCKAKNITLRGLNVEGATLEDVFIQLTGRRIRA